MIHHPAHRLLPGRCRELGSRRRHFRNLRSPSRRCLNRRCPVRRLPPLARRRFPTSRIRSPPAYQSFRLPNSRYPSNRRPRFPNADSPTLQGRLPLETRCRASRRTALAAVPDWSPRLRKRPVRRKAGRQGHRVAQAHLLRPRLGTIHRQHRLPPSRFRRPSRAKTRPVRRAVQTDRWLVHPQPPPDQNPFPLCVRLRHRRSRGFRLSRSPVPEQDPQPSQGCRSDSARRSCRQSIRRGLPDRLDPPRRRS